MENIPTIVPIIKNNHENLTTEIRKRVINAIGNAPDLETIQLMELNKSNKDNEIKINKMLEESTVSADNLHEYRLILKVIGLSDEEVNDMLAHENAHANVADKLGAKHLSYKVTILGDGKDSFLFQPYTHIYIPEDWNDEKIKETWKKIAMAPEEYGNKMSPADVEMAQQ